MSTRDPTPAERQSVIERINAIQKRLDIEGPVRKDAGRAEQQRAVLAAIAKLSERIERIEEAERVSKRLRRNGHMAGSLKEIL